MDWTQVLITAITVLVPTGGFLGLFTIREKKTELMLSNASKLIDGWMHLANERQDSLKEKEQTIAEKDNKIDELHRISSKLRHRLDDAHTEAAVARVMKCDIASCTKRQPPFGSQFHMQAEELVESTENEE
jgi:hypothetical protein